MTNHDFPEAQLRACTAALIGVASLVPMLAAAEPATATVAWRAVANSATPVPGGGGRTFNSFNQPSVNIAGTVVLRGSSGGAGGGEPLRGIYSLRLGRSVDGPATVFDSLTEVPQPNNTEYDGALATFTEFPSFPRIGRENGTIATRAQSRPVWTYTLPDGSETRSGTAGVYALRRGQGIPALSQLGTAPGLEIFAVPGAAPGTRFDQFPGSPAVAGPDQVVVKANYTEAGVGKTGIFFRMLDAKSPTQLIASSDTLIPGQPADGVRFGATAPPSASPTHVVFLGVDNEEAPTLGGLYRAPLTANPALQTMVAIGGEVPGEGAGTGFTRLGEALSYDGRYVAFWGAWGEQTRTVTLTCPVDGNADIVAACLEQYPSGSTEVQVPLNQGVFVHDSETGSTLATAKTGADFLDFVYWNFSGRPPGVGGGEEGGEEDVEGPRWRSTSFVAVNRVGLQVQTAFKAQSAAMAGVDGLYLAATRRGGVSLRTLLETGTPGTAVDPAAPAGAVVTAVGLERDSLRGGWLAVSAAMLDAISGESWAGVYVGRVSK